MLMLILDNKQRDREFLKNLNTSHVNVNPINYTVKGGDTLRFKYISC